MHQYGAMWSERTSEITFSTLDLFPLPVGPAGRASLGVREFPLWEVISLMNEDSCEYKSARTIHLHADRDDTPSAEGYRHGYVALSDRFTGRFVFGCSTSSIVKTQKSVAETLSDRRGERT